MYHQVFSPPQKAGICDKCGGELYQRPDDTPETQKHRIEVYFEQTAPLIDYYREQGLLAEVDGRPGIAEIQAELLGIEAHPPDLWAIIVLYVALRSPGYQGVGWGIVVGLVRDCVSLDPLGTSGFVLGMVAFLFAEGRHRRGRILLGTKSCISACVNRR